MHWNFFTGKLDFHKDPPIHEWVSMSLFSRSTWILAERGCSQFTSHYRVHSQLSSHLSLHMVLGLSALGKEIVSVEDVKLWRHLIQPCWWCHSCYPIFWTTFYTRPCVLHIHPLVFKIDSSELQVNPKHPKCPRFLCQFKKNNLSLYTHPHSEKAMATHSSTLDWKIPSTEEPGRLQSMGLQRVGHDWVTSLSLFTFMHWRRKWQPTPVFLPAESQGQRSLVGCHLWGHTESDPTDTT